MFRYSFVLLFCNEKLYSDFIGFGDYDRIILHRLAYFLMGVGFIFAAIRFINRLPQVGRWNSINVIAFVLFFAVGGFAGYRYFSIYHHDDTERLAYLSLNNNYAKTPTVDIVSNELKVEQQGRKLQISSDLRVWNQNRQNCFKGK